MKKFEDKMQVVSTGVDTREVNRIINTEDNRLAWTVEFQHLEGTEWKTHSSMSSRVFKKEYDYVCKFLGTSLKERAEIAKGEIAE